MSMRGVEAFNWFFVPTYNREQIQEEFLDLCKIYYRLKHTESDIDFNKTCYSLMYETIKNFVSRLDGYLYYNDAKESITITYDKYTDGEACFIIDLETGRIL